MNEIIITAATVEEAMAEARKKYSSPDTDLSFDILQMPKKGFLGIGAQPAKVKVTVTKSLPDVDLSSLVSDIRNMKIDEPEEKPKQQPKQKPQQKQQNPQKAQPKPQQPKADPKPAAAPKTEPKPQPQPAVKPAETAKPAAEDSIPVALRKPAERREPPKKQDKKPKAQRPADTRPADEKKKDLLSAVMGVKEEKKSTADFHTVTESSSDKADTRWEKFTDAVEEKWEAVEDRAEKIGDSIEDKLTAAIGKLTGGADSDDEPAEKKDDTRRMEFVTPEEMQFALDFANTLFANMSLPARAVHNPDSRGEEIPEGMVAARIDIVGDDSGILIGHHGETLDAIQYLVNLCASRKSASAKREFVKIVIDIEGYRAKREDTLRALARRMAAKAVKYKRNVVLEPMNPYERRIIHSEVQGIENVSTHSVGSDENRKIVITYEGTDKAPKKSGRGDRRRKQKNASAEPKAERAEKGEKSEKSERPARPDRDTPRTKPVRAKSIDDIRLDLSEDSTVTLGSIGSDAETDSEEVVETRIREY